MTNEQVVTRGLMMKVAIGTVLALVACGLGMYALAQGVMHGRMIYVIESVGALLLGFIGLRVMAGFWVAFFRRRP